jgi:RNA polymerase sigma factor (sigma-70 family)
LTDEQLKEHCRKVLKRIAWRLQYAAKKRLYRETVIKEGMRGTEAIEDNLSDLYVQEVLMQLPEKARTIIKHVVLQGMTEEQVAKKLNMTRQGVSKCKNKYLRQLAEKLTRSA